MDLYKSTKGGSEDNWDFAGIASDEQVDVEGDAILRKSLDLTYAQDRGYVNWDHRKTPDAQIGYLTKCVVIPADGVEELGSKLGTTLSKSASVYVEGTLYRHCDQAIHVQKIMKSVGGGKVPGLGLSLDGAVARVKDTGDIVRAFVRGVAICPAPVHPKTMVQLRKSLELGEVDEPELSLEERIRAVFREELMKSTGARGLSYDEAVLWVLQRRPDWTYSQAQNLVKSTIQARSQQA